jgi:purine nucleoside phosphorylase
MERFLFCCDYDGDKTMWAILADSGLANLDMGQVVHEHTISTPFGEPSATIFELLFADHISILFLARQGAQQQFPPSDINYRANIFALKQLGAHAIVSISSVTSLQKELMPGDCVIPTQYLDKTKSTRYSSFCEPGIVGHVSLAEPVDRKIVKHLKKYLTSNQSYTVYFDKTYVCIDGPAFSTKADAKFFRQIGADVVGMTHFPEYALAREAGLHYLPVTFVVDYAVWSTDLDSTSQATLVDIMQKNQYSAMQILVKLLQELHVNFTRGCAEQGLKNALLTKTELLPVEKQSWLEIIQRD